MKFAIFQLFFLVFVCELERNTLSLKREQYMKMFQTSEEEQNNLNYIGNQKEQDLEMVKSIWQFDQTFWDDFDSHLLNFGLNDYSGSIKKMKNFILKAEGALEKNIANYVKNKQKKVCSVEEIIAAFMHQRNFLNIVNYLINLHFPQNLSYFWLILSKDEKVDSIEKIIKVYNIPKYNKIINFSLNYFKQVNNFIKFQNCRLPINDLEWGTFFNYQLAYAILFSKYKRELVSKKKFFIKFRKIHQLRQYFMRLSKNKKPTKKKGQEQSNEEEVVQTESFNSLQYKTSDKDQTFFHFLNQVVRMQDQFYVMQVDARLAGSFFVYWEEFFKRISQLQDTKDLKKTYELFNFARLLSCMFMKQTSSFKLSQRMIKIQLRKEQQFFKKKVHELAEEYEIDPHVFKLLEKSTEIF